MNTKPVIGANLTQTLYDQNMKTLKPGHSTAMLFANLKDIAGVNSMQSEDQEMKKLTPAFIEQANLSTWYQSNPWGILTDSSKYGVEPLGGPIDFEQPPGYRPGNVLMTQKPKASAMEKMNLKETFANVSSEEPVSFFKTTQGYVAIAAIVFVCLILAFLAYNKYMGKTAERMASNPTDFFG